MLAFIQSFIVELFWVASLVTCRLSLYDRRTYDSKESQQVPVVTFVSFCYIGVFKPKICTQPSRYIVFTGPSAALSSIMDNFENGVMYLYLCCCLSYSHNVPLLIKNRSTKQSGFCLAFLFSLANQNREYAASYPCDFVFRL